MVPRQSAATFHSQFLCYKQCPKGHATSRVLHLIARSLAELDSKPDVATALNCLWYSPFTMFCLLSDKRHSHLCRCHESRWRSGSRTPFILNPSTRCRPLVTIIPQPIDHGIHSVSGWVGSQNQSQCFGEEKNLPMLGTKPQFLKYSLQVQCQKHITLTSTEYSRW